MSSIFRMFKMLRRLASWDEARIRRLERLLDADDARASAELTELLGTPEFEKKFKSALANNGFDRLIDRVLKHREGLRQKQLHSLCQADNAVFLPQARIENLANDASRIAVGEGTHVRAELLVFRFGGTMTIGKHGYIGENSRVWAGEQVTIGDHVLISHDVFITDCNAHELDAQKRATTYQRIVSTGHPEEKGDVLTKPVSIGDFAWINPQCVILPGVSVGERSIVAAGSVVTADIPSDVLAGGNPARVIRQLES